jgi:hypothetical protein
MSSRNPDGDLPLPPEPERRRYDRRTGVALLSLVAATNVIPWMELLLGGTETAELLDPSEIRIAVGTCFLALLFLLGAWFWGRRRPIPARPRLRNPRGAGLRLSIAAAAGNLALTGAIRWIGARRAMGLPAELPLFAAAWYLVILPFQIAAGLNLGRAGQMPGRRGGSAA